MPSSGPTRRAKTPEFIIVGCKGSLWFLEHSGIGLQDYWRHLSANSSIVECGAANPTSFLRPVVGSASLLPATAFFWRIATYVHKVLNRGEPIQGGSSPVKACVKRGKCPSRLARGGSCEAQKHQNQYLLVMVSCMSRLELAPQPSFCYFVAAYLASISSRAYLFKNLTYSR